MHSNQKKKNTKHKVNIMVQKQVKKALKQKKRSILRNYVHLKQWVFLILLRNLLTVDPAKKAKFENKSQGRHVILAKIIVGKN